MPDFKPAFGPDSEPDPGLRSAPSPERAGSGPGPDAEVVRVTIWLRGRVQNVGMRWWVRARALERGLVGSATNLLDGRVEVVAQGSRAALTAFAHELGGAGAPGQVTGTSIRWSAARAGIVEFVERP